MVREAVTLEVGEIERAEMENGRLKEGYWRERQVGGKGSSNWRERKVDGKGVVEGEKSC